MAQPVEQSKIDSIRELQDRINSSINAWLSSAHDPSKSDEEIAAYQFGIWTAAEALGNLTTPPILKVLQHGWKLAVPAAARTAIDLNLFALVDSETTVDQLHQWTGADSHLLQRIMRILAADGWFREVGEDCFAANEYSRCVRIPYVTDWFKMSFDTNDPVLLQIPSYLASTGYRSPENASDTPSRHAFGKDYFEYLAEHPSQEADFSSSMRIQEIFPSAGIPRYPFEQYLSPDQKPDLNTVSIVDVGGGQGQWLDTVLKDNPYLREEGHRLVMQDLPTVIDNIKRTDHRQDRAFELMAHDFFKPQPILGARYYHLRGILHDWPDTDVLNILRNLRSAFGESSRLLISGWLLPGVNCRLYDAENDFGMMILNGTERSETEYQRLLNQTGFEITGLTRPSMGVFCILEAQVKRGTVAN